MHLPTAHLSSPIIIIIIIGLPSCQTVVMSDAKQRLVQALLRERDSAARAGGGAPGSDADADAEALAAVVDQLSGMGFSPQQVQLAWERQAGAGAGGTGTGASAEALLDWLLVNLPFELLPSHFTTGRYPPARD